MCHCNAVLSCTFVTCCSLTQSLGKACFCSLSCFWQQGTHITGFLLFSSFNSFLQILSQQSSSQCHITIGFGCFCRIMALLRAAVSSVASQLHVRWPVASYRDPIETNDGHRLSFTSPWAKWLTYRLQLNCEPLMQTRSFSAQVRWFVLGCSSWSQQRNDVILVWIFLWASEFCCMHMCQILLP